MRRWTRIRWDSMWTSGLSAAVNYYFDLSDEDKINFKILMEEEIATKTAAPCHFFLMMIQEKPQEFADLAQRLFRRSEELLRDAPPEFAKELLSAFKRSGLGEA
ncbi:MAG: hypothetical protein K1X53_09630 [Candidatus Sumerlaeaceae bacterium]|nr:hypothetical protein [Candidatus Sumerlaeaceae bacterium]